MRRRVRSALLWGLVAVLTVGVAAQGLRLVVGESPGLVAVVATALLAGAAVAGVSYALEARLVARERGNERS